MMYKKSALPFFFLPDGIGNIKMWNYNIEKLFFFKGLNFF